MANDKERLDWLERLARERGGILLHAESGPTGRLGLGLAGPPRSLRQAIDEAIGLRGESPKSATEAISGGDED